MSSKTSQKKGFPVKASGHNKKAAKSQKGRRRSKSLNGLSATVVPHATAQELMCLRERFPKNLTSDAGLSIGFLRNHIKTVLGTQEPVIRCRSTFGTLTSSSGTLTQVVPLSFVTMTGITGDFWAELFDEVQFLGAEIHYKSALQSSATNAHAYFVSVVDYRDGTVLPSSDAALSYDTMRILSVYSHIAQTETQQVQPQGQPDKVWLASTDTTTNLAWLKHHELYLLPNATVCMTYYIESFWRLRQAATI